MFFKQQVNGKEYSAGAGVLAPTPAATAEEAKPAASQQSNGIAQTSSAELARFMPVMDIHQAVARRNIIVEAMRQLMVDGVDYGKIPGCGEKPALLQPGADKLCNLFGLTLQYDFLEKVEDWSGKDHGGEPFFYYQIAAKVFRGEFLIAEGVGACHSWETKYRWRKVERTCPHCNAAAIIKGREEYGGGWLCFARKGGCGAKFYDGDQGIEGQVVGRKPNPDVFDSVNTILKIAYKRCKIHGTINGTSASEFFTQDVEDFTPAEDNIDTGGFRAGTSQAAQYVAEQKIAAGNPASRNTPWRNMSQMADMFKAMREKVGETDYHEELARYGWKRFQDIKNAIDNKTSNAKEKSVECYWHLDAVARKAVA